MPIRFTCPQPDCRVEYTINDQAVGATITCPNCRRALVVPNGVVPTAEPVGEPTVRPVVVERVIERVIIRTERCRRPRRPDDSDDDWRPRDHAQEYFRRRNAQEDLLSYGCLAVLMAVGTLGVAACLGSMLKP